jgi:tripartite-type tricarboxylate transporter receptor subunit TctC
VIKGKKQHRKKMTFHTLITRRNALSIFVMPSATINALAKNNSTIKVILGVPPGSSTDVIARVLSDSLGRSLGQTVIIENKPGGSGSIATQAFLNSASDGNTWLMAVNGFFSETPHTIRLNFDPLKAATPLVEIGGGGLVLVGNPSIQAKDFRELIDWIRSKKGNATYASFSPGSLSHVMGLLLTKAEGLDMLHVPYKGSPPALQDVMGGQVNLMFDAPPSSLPLIKAGKLKAFAISSPKRNESMPDVPTLAELGLGELTRTSWLGIWTTPSIPSSSQQKMRNAVLNALEQPTIRQRMLELGTEVPTGTPKSQDQLMRRLTEDHSSIGAILRSINYRPE